MVNCLQRWGPCRPLHTVVPCWSLPRFFVLSQWRIHGVFWSSGMSVLLQMLLGSHYFNIVDELFLQGEGSVVDTFFGKKYVRKNKN